MHIKIEYLCFYFVIFLVEFEAIEVMSWAILDYEKMQQWHGLKIWKNDKRAIDN